ncbi:DUF4350 domain-containing protein [Erythrobacter sp. YT30]|uniref:DUF4350 domain-containing protein n=1 Tax=Erythrobacter sp. YT30 TaxID=1735012 RepID=UPI00076DA4C6|nr:DUF4350 domain-containing protein [Erythrobacter sp. YT30]KWV91847.1 hypothetical protein AUC45_11725 [Erythrobacter sp. YT30]
MSGSEAIATAQSGRAASPFGKATLLFVIVIGFAAFLALLYFLSGGDDGQSDNNGAAHAAATGLNGYAGLVRLLESEGYDVETSRSPSGLETSDLLVLTPPSFMNPEDLSEILQDREYVGPTLVILPKWWATLPPRNLPDDVSDKFKRGWVQLNDGTPVGWSEQLPEPFKFEHQIEQLEDDEKPGWQGYGLSGELPTRTIAYVEESELFAPLVTDTAGHVLAMNVLGSEGSEYYDNAQWTVFVVEPDLMNNFGLADETRAAAALALVQEAGYGPGTHVTFDLTLNGFGGTMNLLTLAFRPPFLAATLCLLLAMFIVGWRAFLRFGPAAASGPDIAFGKKRLVGNGAGLIVRAGRLRLLAEPYAALSAARIARAMGLARHDPETIDTAMQSRLPQEEPFTHRAAKLRNATSASEIVRAAKSLSELVTTIEDAKHKNSGN